MSKEQLKTLSDEDILAAAEQIIVEELNKSQSEEAKEAQVGKKLTEAVDEMAEMESDEAVDEHKKKMHKESMEKGCEDMGMDVKKSQSDLEGKETGGLAPSVQGDKAALAAGTTSKGGSETEANKGNHIENKSPSEEGGSPSKETQTGDSEEEANKKAKKHLMKDGDPAAEGGGSDGRGQTGSSQDEANKGQMFDLMKKSIVELSKAVKALNTRISSLETTKPVEEKEEMRKSLTQDTIEVLAKSYNKKIRSLESENEELKKSFTDKFEALEKSQKALAQENAEFKAKLNKPAHTRQTATAFEAIQKGNSEETPGPIFKSKHDVLERMEELRKSGKISGDELISFNASGHMTENVKKQLRK